jgi:hypothetical protein
LWYSTPGPRKVWLCKAIVNSCFYPLPLRPPKSQRWHR